MDADTLVSADIAAKLAAAVSEFESGLRIGPDGDSGLAVTGEPFVACSLAGRYDEGELLPMGPTAFAVIDQWLVAARALFRINENSVLYWRTRPEIQFQPYTPARPPFSEREAGWMIYSRFLISDKPAKGE